MSSHRLISVALALVVTACGGGASSPVPDPTASGTPNDPSADPTTSAASAAPAGVGKDVSGGQNGGGQGGGSAPDAGQNGGGQNGGGQGSSTGTTSCQGGIAGNGNVTTKPRAATGFTSVELDVGDADVREGSQFQVQIETDENLQQYVTADVVGGTLRIYVNGANTSICTDKLRAIVTMPQVRGVSLEGAGNIKVQKSSSGNMLLALDGAGDIDFSGQASALTINLTGAGDVTLHGSAQSTTVNLSGVGDVTGSGFSPGSVNENNSGVGNIGL